jgi:hypothetical protein
MERPSAGQDIMNRGAERDCRKQSLALIFGRIDRRPAPGVRKPDAITKRRVRRGLNKLLHAQFEFYSIMLQASGNAARQVQFPRQMCPLCHT